MSTVFTTALVILVASSIAITLLNPDNWIITLEVWMRFTILRFLGMIGLVAITIAMYVKTIAAMPFLRYGWLNLFYPHGGNALITPAINLPPVIAVIAVVFFFLCAPKWAYSEEKQYREGKTDMSEIIPASIRFGFAHCLVGVPLAAGACLSVTGFVFAIIYCRALSKTFDSREALLVTSACHASYNTIVFGLITCMIFIH